MVATGSAPEGKLRSLLYRLLGYLWAFSGWFLVYAAVGGLAGFAVTHPYTYEPGCLPGLSVGGVIESNCPVQAVNWFWSIIVGWPRLLIVFPAIAFALLKAAIKNGWWERAEDGAIWLMYSTPFLLLVWAGTLYWWRRCRDCCRVHRGGGGGARPAGVMMRAAHNDTAIG